jgi:putative thioredoxin
LQDFIKISDDDFSDKVIQSSHSNVVVVIFCTNWCSATSKVLSVLKSIKNFFDEFFEIVLIDVEDSSEMINRYNIKSVPDIKIYKDGIVVEEFLGYRDSKEIHSLLSKYINSNKEIQLSQLKYLYEKDISRAKKLAKDLYSVYKDDSDYILIYTNILITLKDTDKAYDLLSSIEPYDKNYKKAKILLLDDSHKEKDMRHELDMIYSTAVEKVANGEYTSAVSSLVDMYKLDPDYKDNQAKKLILNILENEQLENAVNSIDELSTQK